MKKALLVSALSLCVAFPALAEDVHADPAHWGYFGDEAAHKWGDLNAGFEVCKVGVEQSPINISQYVQEALSPLNGTYAPSPLVVENNGHTVQVNFEAGSGFRAYGKDFSLLQAHFHTPSEHYIDGAPYPMEAHFVHRAEDGALGVVAVMFKVGEANPTIEGIWQNVPAVGVAKAVSGVAINARDLMPADMGYYAYEGSLTMPPCSEGVKWFVVKEPITLSAKQLTAFQAVFPVNARPIQDLGGRVVKGD
ncbi:MAG: carbonate dehydratase [Alphaproteobacteria bacterium]|nr:carbonate dehydratase [Alphaproteobacteria bacterium]